MQINYKKWNNQKEFKKSGFEICKRIIGVSERTQFKNKQDAQKVEQVKKEEIEQMLLRTQEARNQKESQRFRLQEIAHAALSQKTTAKEATKKAHLDKIQQDLQDQIEKEKKQKEEAEKNKIQETIESYKVIKRQEILEKIANEKKESLAKEERENAIKKIAEQVELEKSSQISKYIQETKTLNAQKSAEACKLAIEDERRKADSLAQQALESQIADERKAIKMAEASMRTKQLRAEKSAKFAEMEQRKKDERKKLKQMKKTQRLTKKAGKFAHINQAKYAVESSQPPLKTQPTQQVAITRPRPKPKVQSKRFYSKAPANISSSSSSNISVVDTKCFFCGGCSGGSHDPVTEKMPKMEEGWLLKYGEKSNDWKGRWCSINAIEKSFNVFSNPNNPKLFAQLKFEEWKFYPHAPSSITNHNDDIFYFEKGDQKYVLKAENKQSANTWKIAIEYALKKL